MKSTKTKIKIVKIDEVEFLKLKKKADAFDTLCRNLTEFLNEDIRAIASEECQMIVDDLHIVS